MRKKLCVAVSFAMLVMSLVGCGLSDFGIKEDEPSGPEIEVSASKITLEVGEEDTFEVENFDDLKKVKIEVEDEDIAEADIDDDGVITVEGKEEGKTTITVSAKECEDVAVTVKVTAPANKEDSDTGSVDDNNSSGSTEDSNSPDSSAKPDSQSDSSSAVSGAGVYEQYEGVIPYDIWSSVLDMDETDEFTVELMDLFKKMDVNFKARLNLDLTNQTYGTGEFVVDIEDFMSQVRLAFEDEELYLDYMTLMLGEEMDEETKEEVLSMQSEFISYLVSDEENTVTEVDWEYDTNSQTITISGDKSGGTYSVNDDGSFDFMVGEAGVWVTFVPVN